MKMSEHHAWFMRGKSFTVEIKCWQWSDTEWAWNIYVHVFDNHPLFKTPRVVYENAPLSGGCTFDRAEINSPFEGVVYTHQRVNKKYTFGCDYRHIWDDDYSLNGPDLMPCKIKNDAEELFKWMEDRE